MIDVSTIRNDLVGYAQRRETVNFVEMVKGLMAQNDVQLLDSLHVLHISVWLTELSDELWKKLLKFGCNPFACDFNGDTTLHYAVRSNNLKYIQHLYAKLGDRVLNVVNHQLCNLMLTCAAEAPDEKSFEILLMLEWLYMHGVSLEAQDSQGKTSLMWAAQRNSLTICHWLLSRGAHLAHRDHMNRTALHVACSNGNYDVALFLCEKGAVNMVNSESHDDRRINTPIRIAWQRGHLWLALSLVSWRLSHAVFGHCSMVSSPYAWIAFGLILWNGLCGEWTILQLMRRTKGEMSTHLQSVWLAFTTLIGCTIVFWLTAAKKDPGSVKKQSLVLPSQAHLCSDSAEADLAAYEKASYLQVVGASQHDGSTSSLMALHRLQVESKKIALQMARLNRLVHGSMRRDIRTKIEGLVHTLSVQAEEMNNLRARVGDERRLLNHPAYVERIREGPANVNVCLTCHHIKKIRQHHCQQCGICVRRFDHHCAWVDNCIGLTNQSPFLGFLYSMCGSLAYYFYIVAVYLRVHIHQNSNPFGGSSKNVITVANVSTDEITRNLLRLLFSPLLYIQLANCLANVLWLCFSGYLLVRTTRSMLTDVTFYESLKRFRYVEMRFKPYMGHPHALWDFADCTPASCFLNSVFFLAQNDGRDAINYPEKDPYEERATRGAHTPLLATNVRDETIPVLHPQSSSALMAWEWSNMLRTDPQPTPSFFQPPNTAI